MAIYNKEDAKAIMAKALEYSKADMHATLYLPLERSPIRLWSFNQILVKK